MSVRFDILPLPEITDQGYIPWPVVVGAIVFVGLCAFLIVRAILKKKAKKEEVGQ